MFFMGLNMNLQDQALNILQEMVGSLLEEL